MNHEDVVRLNRDFADIQALAKCEGTDRNFQLRCALFLSELEQLEKKE